MEGSRKWTRSDNVYNVSLRILRKLEALRSMPQGKADLAALRNSIGKPIGQSVDIFPLLYPELPDEMIGKSGTLTEEEQAILLTTQVYALHQQGKSESVLWRPTEDGPKSKPLGDSLRGLRNLPSKSIDQRFNAFVTSEDLPELMHHLRQLIKLLKANANTTVDYPSLAKDLYWFQKGSKESLRLNWARAYYRMHSEQTNTTENTEKEN